MQQEYPFAVQGVQRVLKESSACSGPLVLLSSDAPCELVRPQTAGASTGGRA